MGVSVVGCGKEETTAVNEKNPVKTDITDETQEIENKPELYNVESGANEQEKLVLKLVNAINSKDKKTYQNLLSEWDDKDAYAKWESVFFDKGFNIDASNMRLDEKMSNPYTKVYVVKIIGDKYDFKIVVNKYKGEKEWTLGYFY